MNLTRSIKSTFSVSAKEKEDRYWQDHANALYEKEKSSKVEFKKLQKNQEELKKRAFEAQWLLQGISNFKDIFVPGKVTDQLDENKKSEDTIQESGPDLSILQRLAPWTSPGKSRTKVAPGSEDSEEVESSPAPVRKIRNIFTEKESIAKALADEDERKNRTAFIKENAKKIKMLSQVRVTLRRARMAKHHAPSDEMKYYEAENELRLLTVPDDIQEQNLRNYTVVPPTRIIEELKPIEEIIDEEIEANKFRVGAWRADYKDPSQLTALKGYPETVKVLMPPGTAANSKRIVENNLLPNPEEKRAMLMNEFLKDQKEKRKQFHLKKSAVDMTRHQFHLHTPRSVDKYASERHISTQFQYKEKQKTDENSVHEYPHPTVLFKRDAKTAAANDISTHGMHYIDDTSTLESYNGTFDSVAIESIQKYHLGLDDDSTVTFGQNWEHMQSDVLSSLHFEGSRTMSRGDQVRNKPNNSVLRGQARPKTVQNDLRSQTSQDFYSEDAIRSNFASENSQIPQQPLVRVHLTKHRGVNKLNRFKLKNHIHLQSLRSKEYDAAKQKVSLVLDG